MLLDDIVASLKKVLERCALTICSNTIKDPKSAPVRALVRGVERAPWQNWLGNHSRSIQGGQNRIHTMTRKPDLGHAQALLRYSHPRLRLKQQRLTSSD